MADIDNMYEKQELIPDFLHECRSYTEKLSHLLVTSHKLISQKQLVTEAIVNEMFRLVHTIKGTSSYMGFTPIKRLSHQMEQLLERIRDGKLDCSSHVCRALVESQGQLDQLFNALEHRELHLKDISQAISCLEAAEKESPVLTSDSEDLLQRAPVQKTIRINKERYITLLSAILSSFDDIAQLQHSIESLDDVLIDFKEKGIHIETLKPILEVSSHLEFLSSILSKRLQGINTSCLMARMQSLGGVLKRFKQVILDLSLRQGKQIQVNISGLDVEVDTLVCDALSGILIHMIRNIVDHGIESKVDRLKKGKDETALVKMQAKIEGEFLVFELTDDGCGIDTDALVERALHRNLVSQKDIEKMDHDQKVQLMFVPGISTAKELTDTSGRGVGMDAILKLVEELGGVIQVFTQKNVGTKMSIRLPVLLNLLQEKPPKDAANQVQLS